MDNDKLAQQPVTSDDIKNLPTRNVNALASVSAGATSEEEGETIQIRGARSSGTEFYMDGINVNPQASIKEESGDLLGDSPAAFANEIEREESVMLFDQVIETAAMELNIPDLWKDTDVNLAALSPPPPPPPPPPANSDNTIFKVVENQPLFLAAECQGLTSKAERQKCAQEKLKLYLHQKC